MQDILEDAFVLGNLGRIGPLFCMDLALKKKKQTKTSWDIHEKVDVFF